MDESGNEVNGALLQSQESELKYHIYGSLEEDVYLWATSAPPDEIKQFDIWLSVEHRDTFRPTSDEMFDLYYLLHFSYMSELSERIINKLGVLSNRLDLMGIKYFLVSSYAPITRTEMVPHQVLDLMFDENVGKIRFYVTEVSLCQVSDQWKETVRAYWVNSAGNTGNGIRVSIKEYDRIPPSQEYYFDDIIEYAEQNVSSGCQNSHSGKVTSMINTVFYDYGIAPDSDIYIQNDCDFSDPIYPTTDDWANSRDVHIRNFSGCFGNEFSDDPINSAEAWHDYLSYYNSSLFTESTGNSAGYVCNKPFNTIKVGGTYDNDTSNRTDDTMYGGSSWMNPIISSPHNDRELPEVVAPAYALWVPGYGDNSGTSLAAPIVAGVAALIQWRNPYLKFWPEQVKAIIMATAFCNIEGSINPLWDSDAKDGAGEVDAYIAHILASQGNKKDGGDPASSYGYDYGYLAFSAHFDISGTYYEKYRITTQFSSKKVRIVLTWDARPTCDFSSDPPMPSYRNCWDDILDADLDIYLYRVYGSGFKVLVASSATYDNSYEIIDYNLSPNCQYELQIKKRSQNRGNTYFAVAWYVVNNSDCI